MKRLFPIWLTLAVLFGAVMLRAQDPVFLSTLRHALFDAYQRWKPRPYQPSPPIPVRIVDIDEESLSRLGQWPLPRNLQAEIVERLRDMGAKAIAFDILFAEPDRSSPSSILSRLPETERPAFQSLIDRLPDHDAELERAVAGGRVVLGFSPADSGEVDPLPPPRFRIVAPRGDPRPHFLRFDGAVTALPALVAAAGGVGAQDFWPETDGVVRRFPLLLTIGGEVYPSLAAEAVRVALGVDEISVRISASGPFLGLDGEGAISGLRIGAHPVFTDGRGRLWLHFTPSRRERYLPAWKLLAGEISPEQIRNAIIFVGTSAKGLHDLRYIPLGGAMPGVEIQAQIAEQILQRDYLIRPDWADSAEIAFIGLLSFAVLALMLRFGPLMSVLIWGLATMGTFAQSLQLYSATGLLFDPVFPAMTVLLVYIVMSVTRHAHSEGERRWIREAFKSYVSPNLVEEIINHPATLQLGGERRELSFVFTDLEDFTRLVEKAQPGELIPLLNEYLNAMIRIGFRHGGTLDKIVGDATAFFFNAPVPQADHAERALACALEMDAFASAFSRRKRTEGHAVGTTRIGVHTGSVIVGNMGGDILFNYCAHGDAINTASRLEGANKYLGTRICVSGETAGRCKRFLGRPVGNLLLKGKQDAIAAFEPLPDGETEASAAYRKAYALLESNSPDAFHAFVDLAERFPDDPLAALHLERMRRGDRCVTITLNDK
ncbi:MAG: adenylate/guanylate cyclase domain-containing protein [Magnetospirillum sp. WYHS-4]